MRQLEVSLFLIAYDVIEYSVSAFSFFFSAHNYGVYLNARFEYVHEKQGREVGQKLSCDLLPCIGLRK